MYKTILTDLTDNILTVMINRPDKLNAINKDVMSELGEVVEEIYSNQDIRSAIITGAGQKAFIAGADISEFQGLSREEGQALSARGHNIFFRIASCPKPIAAAINGFALGGGCELAMACHFRLCVPTARFGQPEVNLGLIPGYGGTQRLVQLVGRGRAIEIMLAPADCLNTHPLSYGGLKREPHLSLTDYEVIEHVWLWLGTDEGAAWLADCQREIDRRQTAAWLAEHDMTTDVISHE